MLTWWLILFALAVMSFIDTFFGVGDIFRQVTAAAFLLASLGLLARISRKVSRGEREKLTERIAQLEQELAHARMIGNRESPVSAVPERV